MQDCQRKLHLPGVPSEAGRKGRDSAFSYWSHRSLEYRADLQDGCFNRFPPYQRRTAIISSWTHSRYACVAGFKGGRRSNLQVFDIPVFSRRGGLERW